MIVELHRDDRIVVIDAVYCSFGEKNGHEFSLTVESENGNFGGDYNASKIEKFTIRANDGTLLWVGERNKNRRMIWGQEGR